jgi:1-acyl-sn-glycerol-3-phosphate acyltransferase
MGRALRRNAALLVYPGGDQETYRQTSESAGIDLAHRMGFVKLAREHDVPIVPVVALGGQETALFLGRGRRMARAQAGSLDASKGLSARAGPPFGLTILDLPIRFPLPAKISIRALKPIDLRERLGRSPDVAEGYQLVSSTMQRQLTRLSNERTLPLVG